MIDFSELPLIPISDLAIAHAATEDWLHSHRVLSRDTRPVTIDNIVGNQQNVPMPNSYANIAALQLILKQYHDDI